MKLGRTKAILILCLLLGFANPDPTQAEVVLKEKITYYTVSGKYGREIFKSMLAAGPKVGLRNEHASASTEYEYDVRNIDMKIENGRCVPRNLDVYVIVKYLYPKWGGVRGASGATRRAWNNFSKSVVWH